MGTSLGYTDVSFPFITPETLAANSGELAVTARPKWTGNAYASYETEPLFDDATLQFRLDERTRRILVMGSMIALGTWDEFKLHVRAALAAGALTPDDIKEIILQQAIYCGVPAANHAFKEAASVMAELGKAG